jgi:hypothetical protein
MMSAQEKPSAGQPDLGPLFVVGMWRSGTSLFYALLNQHPQIALLYEGDLPLLWPLFLGRRAKMDWPERWQFWNSAPSRHRLDLDKLPRDVSGLREACEIAWKQHAGAAIGGCKSPNYFDMLPSLAAQFPNARFIVIWRNPVEICRSVVRAARNDSFFARRGMILRTLRGCHDLKTGVENLRTRQVLVHEIQYETLVDDPAEVMAGVCSFLNLPLHAGMTTLEHADRSAIYDGAHHEMVKSEGIKATKNKKKIAGEVLSERVLRKIDRYIASWHERYEKKWPATPENARLSGSSWFVLEEFFDRILYRMFRAFDHAVAFIYCFAPLWLLRRYRAAKASPEAAALPKENLVGASVKD